MQTLTAELKLQLGFHDGNPKVAKQIDARVAMDIAGLCKQLKHKSRQSSRKANHKLKKDRFLQDEFGNYFHVRSNIALAPFNGGGATQYLVPANTLFVAVQQKGWLALYITHGRTFNSIEELAKSCVKIRAKDSEVRRVNIPVMFREAAKVAFKKMLPADWATSESHLANVKKLYDIAK